MKKFISFMLCAVLMLGTACDSLNNTSKGAMIGVGGGAAAGAGLGAIFGGGKGAAIGAAVGAVAGGVAGTLIGKKMDKQKKELEAINGATVETVTDQNNNPALKVTLESGILFATGKSNLSNSAKSALNTFATALLNNPETNVQIAGHTDNTGSRATNERLSLERANSVRNYLMNAGVSGSRMSAEGCAYDYPVASNDTEAGRAQNRRVEIYISANEQMINQANAGTLQ